MKAPVGFDFTGHMRAVCEDMVTRLEALRHIDLQRVAVCFSRSRRGVAHGVHASLTPLRFAKGATTGVVGRRKYRLESVVDERGREMLYILRFYLPRCWDVPFHEKLVTLLHELWHISPDFDGDLRRHEGRCYMHTHSQAGYDAEMAQLADQWLALDPPRSLYEIFHEDFAGLLRRYGRIYGVRIRQPKLIPVQSVPSAGND